MGEKLTWWRGLLVFSAVTIAGATVWSAVRGKGAATAALASLEGPPGERVSGPLISVVIPTWNEADYLGDLLTSLANQTYEPLEFIIADWNSTDETREVAASFGAKVVDVLERGVGPARNVGAAAATGEFLLFIDADNIFEPTLVEDLMVELLSRDTLITHPRIAYYEGSGMYHATRWMSAAVMPSHNTTRCVLIRREAFDATGGYPNIWREDLWLGAKVRELFGSGAIAYLPYAICATSTRREVARFQERWTPVKSPYFPAVRNGIYQLPAPEAGGI